MRVTRGAQLSAGHGVILTRRAWLAAALAATASNIAAAVPPIFAVSHLDIPRTTSRGKSKMASDPVVYLDRVALLCEFPVRENGETFWPQGVSINRGARKIYVSNQKGTKLRIDVRTFPSGVRVSSRIVTTEDQCWTEALPWFYNESGTCVSSLGQPVKKTQPHRPMQFTTTRAASKAPTYR